MVAAAAAATTAVVVASRTSRIKVLCKTYIYVNKYIYIEWYMHTVLGAGVGERPEVRKACQDGVG